MNVFDFVEGVGLSGSAQYADATDHHHFKKGVMGGGGVVGCGFGSAVFVIGETDPDS